MKVYPYGNHACIRVLVADSNQTQSQLLSSALRRQHHMKVSCCRSELAGCLGTLQSIPIDIVVLGGDPFDHNRLVDTTQALHTAFPHVGIVLLIDGYDRPLVVNAMRAGARGLFCRAAEPFRALCRCISVVHQGQFWANTEQIGYIVDALSSNLPRCLLSVKGEPLLTDREWQIVKLVAEGLPNRDISQLLGIKENTVKKALLRTYDKLGVSNRVELALYVLTHRDNSKILIERLPEITDGARPIAALSTALSRVNVQVKSERAQIPSDVPRMGK